MSVLNLLLIAAEAVLASFALPLLAALLARAFPLNAGLRRLVWATLFAVLLALPLAAALSPSLDVITLHAPAPAAGPAPMAAASATAEPSLSVTAAGLLLGLYAWAVGALWIVARSLIGLVRLHLLKRGSEAVSPERLPLPLPPGCRVRLSPECTGPMTWGAVRPLILLPDDALGWPRAKLEAALRHELAHVRRKDSLVQALALVACALYWPNPLVWRAARALRREAEAAADDAVLASGMRPSDYASLLLDLANQGGDLRRSELEMAMASPPILSERVQSILSTKASRTGATAMDAFKLTLIGGTALAGLALAHPSLAEIADPAPQAQSVQLTPAARPDIDPRPTPAKAQPNIQLAQAAAAPAPPTPAASPAIPPLPGPPTAGHPVTVPYNQVTDDPASPGYIAPGQPGAQHPVPADLAKLLNARKGGPNQPWTLAWIPGPPPGSPAPAQPAAAPAAAIAPLPPLPAAALGGAAHPAGPFTLQWIPGSPSGAKPPTGMRVVTNAMTPEQQADLDRKLAAIGPAVDKAIAEAHIDEAVQKALAAQDPKTREEVAKQLQQVGPLVEQAVAMAHIQEIVKQRVEQAQASQPAPAQPAQPKN